jgi:hypothetical protein
MRVSVHSGSVNYEIIGTKRIKFDIFEMMFHWLLKRNQLEHQASVFSVI